MPAAMNGMGKSKKMANHYEDESPSGSIAISAASEQLSTDLAVALNEKEFSDATIVCGDQQFDVHRIILGSRSSVFRAMFNNDMTEGNSNKIEVKKMEPEVLKALLVYIYTGQTNFSIKPEEVLKAAEMYDLRLLKNFYEEKLCTSLDISNVNDMLVLGDLHRATTLKRDAMKLIVDNLEDREKVARALLCEQWLEDSASQLTYHGLCELYSVMKEGKTAVFFRNNHFHTCYKAGNTVSSPCRSFGRLWKTSKYQFEPVW